MIIETERLMITEFDLSMAESVHKNSLDEDNRRFVPDEVFETIRDATETIHFLMSCYETNEGPLVYPILIKTTCENIGYVQLVPIKDEFEVGYHIAKQFTRNGYATEALKGFLEYIKTEKKIHKVYGICVSENIASKQVLEKCGFEKIFEGTGTYQKTDKNVLKYVYLL
uniref:GNAT family N-acetyltransferase n=1 Tax=Agathobacter sp. TaxID=2021311 RepID=UPI0040564944